MRTSPARAPAAFDRPEHIDDGAADDSVDWVPVYEVLSYGADLDVSGLVQRLKRMDIELPSFQRRYVWTDAQAARFVESLLLGLPVPGIFLWRHPETRKLVVIDGQQRLRTLLFFYNGQFDDGRPFILPKHASPYQNLNPAFQQQTYSTLDEGYRRRLDDSIIHATIVQQDRPLEDDSSIYYIFERLNTSGTPLDPQEIRTAIYGKSLNELLKKLNGVSAWRDLYGQESARMKDHELILRFFALSEAEFSPALPSPRRYAQPMKEFLNRYASRIRRLDEPAAACMLDRFSTAITLLSKAVGKRAFKPGRNFNAAVFDSVMVGLDRRLQSKPAPPAEAVALAYDHLLNSDDYRRSYARSTANEDRVQQRLALATKAFADLA